MSRPSTTIGLVAGHERADDHLHPGDVRRRQRQQPPPGPAQPAGRRLDAGEHGAAREHDALGPARGPGGLDQQRLGVVGLEPPRQLPDRDRGLVRGPEETHTTNASRSGTMIGDGRHRDPGRGTRGESWLQRQLPPSRSPARCRSSRSCSPSARAPSSPARRCSSPRSSGLSAAQVGIGLTVAGIASFFFAVPAGKLADRIGTKRIWAISAALHRRCSTSCGRSSTASPPSS